jgi:hypothetical protein
MLGGALAGDWGGLVDFFAGGLFTTTVVVIDALL